MENVSSDKPVRHVIQTILAQIVDVNNHVRSVQDNAEMAQEDKIATSNFAHYHLMVLAILLKELEDIAREKFPDAKPIIDWAADHYNKGLANNAFKPCQCTECKPVEPATEQVEEVVEEIQSNT